VAVVEAMKMEHVIVAERSGIVRRITMSVGEVVRERYPIVLLEPADVDGERASAVVAVDLDLIRGDLQANIDRHAYTLDANRPAAVARRRARGYRMPRENIAQLVDPGSFKEYWPLLVARQHLRYDMETLRRDTPDDGLIAGTASINGDLFPEERSGAMVVSYDYTVLAGTQGVIIATEGSTIAMGGPAMIEGGGLGIYTPEEIGPMSVQVPNGVVDILVPAEAHAAKVAKKYLSYFQGPIKRWEAPDQRRLRHIVPENRLRLYDMREIVTALADSDSTLEIREKFGVGVITAFIRIEGRPMGVIANNPPISPEPSTPTAPTRSPGSCNSATPSTSPS
jgi:acetyl-CoA carboxylase carboxyltransferase component